MQPKTLFFLISGILIGCSSDKPERKGFTVNNSSPEETEINKTGLQSNSTFSARPNAVLLTTYPEHRLIPIYKLNYRENRGEKTYFTGSNSFHSSYWSYGESDGNNWNNNFMPGFEAMYGYNLVNIHHYNTQKHEITKFFENPVLIKTLYYPTLSNDTLNNSLVKRNYYMVSAYSEDSNGDGYVNSDDLRRFFLFNIDGTFNTLLIPNSYSVRSSQYDPENDYMYVYAILDENKNGHQEETEEVHVFWIDLNSPSKGTRLF